MPKVMTIPFSNGVFLVSTEDLCPSTLLLYLAKLPKKQKPICSLLLKRVNHLWKSLKAKPEHIYNCDWHLSTVPNAKSLIAKHVLTCCFNLSVVCSHVMYQTVLCVVSYLFLLTSRNEKPIPRQPHDNAPGHVEILGTASNNVLPSIDRLNHFNTSYRVLLCDNVCEGVKRMVRSLLYSFCIYLHEWKQI